MFPTIVCREGTEFPEGSFYAVAKNGLFFHKATKFGSGFIPVKGIPNLSEVNTDFQITLPVLPAKIVNQAFYLFRRVFQNLRSESYVTLYYSEKIGFRLHCPAQTVSGGHVSYDRNDQIPFPERKQDGWNMVGTIHSHCDFSAFHSGVDERDEASFDGLHITLGHVNRDEFSIATSLAVNEIRFVLDPLEYLGGLEVANVDPESHRNRHSRNDIFYRFLENNLEESDITMIEQQWLPKIKGR